MPLADAWSKASQPPEFAEVRPEVKTLPIRVLG
jgi:hypothetical protein